MKRGITLRTDRRGRRFALNIQIGYDGGRYDDGNTPPKPEASSSEQDTPPKTEGYAKSYANIKSYEQ